MYVCEQTFMYVCEHTYIYTTMYMCAVTNQLIGLLSVGNARELNKLLLIGVVVQAVRIYTKCIAFNIRRCI